MKLKLLITSLLIGLAISAGVQAAPLKIAYSDWPGYTVLEIAKQKGWFKDAGLDVELDWFEYLPSIDAYSAGKVDSVLIVATDAMVTGSTAGKGKIIALLDYSEGSDMIVGAPGIESIKDLKGKDIGIELTLVEHLLLLKALEVNGMKQSDVNLVNTATDKTPQTLASGKVAAIGAWYPISGQALKQVPGAKKLFTSAEAKGLIYDVMNVNPSSYAHHKEEWTKIVAIYYKCVDYLNDPATKDDAIKIMSAKVGADPVAYAKNVPGTHFLTLAEAKERFKVGAGMDSIYGSMDIGNKFNLDNAVYKISQKPAKYLVPEVVMGLK
ncbi:ABC transporter substrate-binding protein [Pedosphaera parvula]|uniref:NlpA lipoprotein n=1 Tax=Pedosphaera parvula (strain Ellin514) TaxID=320771 RepID=B9XA60_PEDPL|nr:ABC transporter substrate-binding protein [Pedosphaera parvula]EEF63401.1 NlpA lipoprotein [Pedosphaera parvula Ellin514]